MYALVDCNNFFVSCERAFQPQLEGKAVVVLSNNDGCVVARSQESKDMAIKMGTPFFKLKNLVDSGALIVRSSNYKLYGDMSDRVMSILRSTGLKLEVYSIDEAFLTLDGVPEENYRSYCLALVRRIRQWTGIPVSIGIAPTKTLGKVANHFAKKYKGYRGVCTIDDDEKRLKALELTPVGDVWGVGWRMTPKLEAMGIKTALDFVNRPASWVQKHMGITGVRTWQELQGVPAVQEEKTDRRQSICTSRSFAQMTSDKAELEAKISDFAAACAGKLRKENSLAMNVIAFAHSNRFREDLEQYFPYGTYRLSVPANSTQEIVAAALRAFDGIYRPDIQYKRAGVIVDEIVAADAVQETIFEYDAQLREKEDTLSALMDRYNTPGSSVLRLASQKGGHYADGIRREHCSQRYSTDWNELLEIH